MVLSDEQYQQAFAAIKIARRFVQAMSKSDPSEKSKALYIKVVKSLLKSGETPLSHARSKASFYQYRAAWICLYGNALKQLLQLNDDLAKKDKEDKEAWYKNACKIAKFNAKLEDYFPDPNRQQRNTGIQSAWKNKAAQMAAAGIPASQSRSKKGSIKAPGPQWRALLFAEVLRRDCKYTDEIACLSVSGCRPAEIESGVACILQPKGHLKITIQGAKTHGGKYGAETRSFVVKDNSVEFKYLYSQCIIAGDKGLLISAKAKAVTDAVIHCRNAVWPKQSHKKQKANRISAYSYRHQLSADLKAQGFDAETIAKIMGHSTDRTQVYYASGSGDGGGRGITEVQSSRKVKMKNAESLNNLIAKQDAGFDDGESWGPR